MKRKNDAEDVVLADADIAKSSKKRRRLSNEEEGKKSKSKDKKDKRDKKEKKEKKPKKARAKVEDEATFANDLPTPDTEAEAESMDVDSEKESKRENKQKKDKKKEKVEKKAKSDKKDKKSKDSTKKDEEELDQANGATAGEANGEHAVVSESKKSKKDKKKNKHKALPEESATQEDPSTSTHEATTNGANDSAGTKKKKDRFIAFVGNLPFSATIPQIQAHFVSVSPIDVRLLHKRDEKGVQKPKGAAFVEFGRYDHMRTALEKLHHTLFEERDDKGKVKKGSGRMINVELTAGGGGKTAYRTEKIRAKNEKLNEERARRAQETEKAKDKKDKKGGKDAAEDQSGIHPSRRHQIAG